jgi:hypothetical protein
MAKSKELKAKQAERIIMLVSGESGSGKSFFCANIPNALIYDTDVGGGLAAYDARIERNGSERIEVGSYPEIITDLKHRGKQLDKINTLVIDHLSVLQQEAITRFNPNAEKDFGAAADKGAREWRKIRDLVRRYDFNLVCCSHLKGKFERQGSKFEQVGMQADASKNIEGDFMIHLHLVTGYSHPAQARRVKWRRDPEDDRGAVPETFEFSLKRVLEIHGWPLDYAREEVPMASPEQIGRLESLRDAVKLPDDKMGTWLASADYEALSEMTAEQICKAIDYCNAIIQKASSGK